MVNKFFSKISQNSKLPEFILLPVALGAFGFAVYQTFNFSSVQFVVLAVAMIVSIILDQHRFTFSSLKKSYSTKEFILFWSVIWLGAAGGVLIAAGVAAGNLVISRKNKNRKIFEGLANITSVFLAATSFYLLLNYFAGFNELMVAETALSFNLIISATALMTGVYFASSGILSAVFSKENNFQTFRENKFNERLWNFLNYVSSFLLTVLFHITFLKFGLAFGVVVLFVTLGGHIAYTLFQARLEQKTKEIVESSRIHLATVEALATAIDARDQVGVGHVRRTQIIAVGIGESLGLSEGEIQALRAGALLHDIGKLAVPDHILNKPGRLTPAEMEKMKIHSSVGASILEKVGFNYPVVPTVKYHHEMWDGGGYPEGLKGENIPLTARILTVADTYDALRGIRSYRDAVSREEARKFLLNGAGKQFDPRIVDIFLRNLANYEGIIEQEGLAYSSDTKTDVFHITDADNPGYVQQIKRANREVFTLYELAKVFSSSLNLQDTLSLFVEKIGEFVPSDTCVIYLLNESGQEASAIYVEGKNQDVLKNKKIRVGQGATGFVLKKQQSVCHINPALDFSFDNIQFVEDYSAMISLPLLANEKILGAVSLYSCELENYGEEHLRLIETVSRIASNAIGKTLYHAETESKALTDPMTGLPNARSLQLQFEKEVARANRAEVNFQVLMLDLDGFKAVNDTFGHKAGDELLKGVAGVMKEQLREYDFLARYAGDEFAAIIPQTEVNAVRDLCYRLEKAVSEFALPVGDGKFARVGVSIGAASYPQNGSTLDQMIIAADKAMYSVKAKHKQRQIPQKQPRTNEVVSIQPNRSRIEKPIIEDHFIVELDESHVISSAIN